MIITLLMFQRHRISVGSLNACGAYVLTISKYIYTNVVSIELLVLRLFQVYSCSCDYCGDKLEDDELLQEQHYRGDRERRSQRIKNEKQERKEDLCI